MGATRNIRITTKQSNQSGSLLPSVASVLNGEGLVNTADGKLFYKGYISGTGATTYLASTADPAYFEIGSHLSNLKLDNRIVAYDGVKDAGLAGKFLSGTTSGFVLNDISAILDNDAYITGGTFNTGSRTLTLSLTNKPSVIVTGITDTTTTGGTFINNILTYTNSTGGTVSTLINNFSGLTVNGVVSATSFSGSGAYLTSIPWSGVTGAPAFITGNQSINFNPSASGDVTGSATGTTSLLPNLIIGNGKVTLAKMANMATASFIGRNSAGTGTPEILSTATTRVMLAINNVDNTSDANKPISNAVQAALDAKGDIHITGATFSGANLLSLKDNSGNTITTTIDNFNGLSVSGNTNISGNMTAANISTGPNGSAVIGTGGLVIGSGGSPTTPGTGDLVVNGNITVYGSAFSAYTSQLYVEDSNIILNYNPTGDTHTTSLGAGITVQDGFNVSSSVDAFFQIAETNVPVDQTDAYGKIFWESNVANIMLGSTGSTGSGRYVLMEFDTLNGGAY